jgi:hypothetical protein
VQTRRPALSGPSKRPLQDLKAGKREAEELSLAGSERCHRCRVGLFCAPVVSFSPQKRHFGRQPPSGPSKRPLQGFKGATKAGGPELGGFVLLDISILIGYIKYTTFLGYD